MTVKPRIRMQGKKKRERNKRFRDTYSGHLRRYLLMVLPEPSKRKCSSCLFFRSRKCSKDSAGQDLVLPTDLACSDYENLRERLSRVDVAKIVDELAPEVPDPMPYESEEALYSSLISYLKDHVIFEDENEYSLVTSWILATWKVADLNEVCYLVIVCPKGHGKTRLIEVLYELCHKAIIASYATRSAGMRLMEGGEITFLLDEGEIVLKATEPDELTALFTSGQRRRAKMIITEEVAEQTPDGKKISTKRPVARAVFGFKAIASREDVFDAIVDRAFEIVLPKGKPKSRKIDYEKAKTLRAHLAYYKQHGPVYEAHIHEKAADLMDGRMIELTETVLHATPPHYVSKIISVALKEVKERAERLADTTEAKLLTIIKEKLDDPNEIKRIEKLGLIPTKEIAEIYNQRYEDLKDPRSTDSLGRVLGRLKLQRMKVREDKAIIRGFKYEAKKLSILYDRFLLDFESLEKTLNEAASCAPCAPCVPHMEHPSMPLTEAPPGGVMSTPAKAVPLHVGVTRDTGDTPEPTPWQTCPRCKAPLTDPYDVMVHMETFHSGKENGTRKIALQEKKEAKE